MTESSLDALASEQANPQTSDLDLLPTENMLRAINQQDRQVAVAVAEVLPAIARAVDDITARLQEGGCLHYFGAGTSGRLGVLDASECPPTFGVPADLVQGHIAGGERALVRSSEGAEDSLELGARDVLEAGVSAADAVVAIAASGRTPYCIGALRQARERGALTIALVCNRPSQMHEEADIVIDPVVGPEVLSGSTRLKAGTAQKMVLNMISTGVMVRTGRTYGNLMVNVKASNEKLKVRAERLVREITGASDVRGTLERCEWDVKAAAVMLRRNVSPDEAFHLLEQHGGSLRKALGEDPVQSSG